MFHCINTWEVSSLGHPANSADLNSLAPSFQLVVSMSARATPCRVYLQTWNCWVTGCVSTQHGRGGELPKNCNVAAPQVLLSNQDR